MATINKRKCCPSHGFYDAIANKSCPKCRKNSNKTYDKTMRAKDRANIYSNKKWRMVREQAMLRDALLCVECKKQGISTRATEVHHIQYLEHRLDLAYELSNLVSLCSKCHMQIHSKDKRAENEKNNRMV